MLPITTTQTNLVLSDLKAANGEELALNYILSSEDEPLNSTTALTETTIKGLTEGLVHEFEVRRHDEFYQVSEPARVRETMS